MSAAGGVVARLGGRAAQPRTGIARGSATWGGVSATESAARLARGGGWRVAEET